MAKTTKSKTTDWYALSWNDAAGRPNTMAGPKYALTDHAGELTKLGIKYTLEKMGYVEEAKTEETVGEEG